MPEMRHVCKIWPASLIYFLFAPLSVVLILFPATESLLFNYFGFLLVANVIQNIAVALKEHSLVVCCLTLIVWPIFNRYGRGLHRFNGISCVTYKLMGHVECVGNSGPATICSPA
jgi:hypothetical protein